MRELQRKDMEIIELKKEVEWLRRQLKEDSRELFRLVQKDCTPSAFISHYSILNHHKNEWCKCHVFLP